MTRVGYYPGCSLHGTAAEYGMSAEAVCRSLGITLAEVPDWNCCGATPAHATNEFVAKALPLRNLILAEQAEEELVVPCTGCYNVCRQTHGFINRGGHKAEEVNRELAAIMGQRYQGKLRIMHLLEFLSRPEVTVELAARIERPLTGLRVVPYYGCLLLRPAEDVAFDDPEQPQKLDELLRLLGADVRPWSYKMDCCGGSLAIPQADIVAEMVGGLTAAARQAGADALVTACPLCQANIDTRQKAGGMPIFYITELIAAALNLSGQQRWLKKHIIDPAPLLRGLGLVRPGGE